MKEKIWIEKLIELLNEFETPQSWVVFKSYDDYDGTFYGVDCDGETEIAWSDSYICGKRFWWIEWLVDNDKIDFSRDWKYCGKSIEEFDWLFRIDEDSLIMILAIQNNPIDFLISILK